MDLTRTFHVHTFVLAGSAYEEKYSRKHFPSLQTPDEKKVALAGPSRKTKIVGENEAPKPPAQTINPIFFRLLDK